MTGLFSEHGIRHVFHYAPLHYLIFIAREGALLSKPALRERGFVDTHFRRTSCRQDEERGFGEYVHLSLLERPPILQAKLDAGFPHFELRIPTTAVETVKFQLCRFNIAKCRYLRRPGGSPLAEGPANGRYYGDNQIPTAVTREECNGLLQYNHPNKMIEVLVPGSIALPDDTELLFFSEKDWRAGERLVRKVGRSWRCVQSSNFRYSANDGYRSAVVKFLERAEADQNWRGNGLEYDAV